MVREMHSLAAVHALHLVEVVKRWDVSAQKLLGPFGLTDEALADPGARLPLETVVQLIDRARTLTGEPGLGFHLGLQMTISSHGYLGFAAMSAPTVRDALALAERYAPTRTSALALAVHVEGDVGRLVIEERAPLGSARDVIIFALFVGITQIGHSITGRPLRGTAHAAFAEPPYYDRFRALIGDVMRFDRPAHEMVFDASLLDTPLKMADPVALKLAREQCQRELDALDRVERAAARVRGLIPRRDLGFRSLDEVAKLMSMSPRTLKRRLADDGTTFSELVDAERRERALELLRSPQLSLDQIADRLGYSDLANFTRAFRRWTGDTPAAFRRARR